MWENVDPHAQTVVKGMLGHAQRSARVASRGPGTGAGSGLNDDAGRPVANLNDVS